MSFLVPSGDVAFAPFPTRSKMTPGRRDLKTAMQACHDSAARPYSTRRGSSAKADRSQRPLHPLFCVGHRKKIRVPFFGDRPGRLARIASLFYR